MQALFVRILLAIYVTFAWPFDDVFVKIFADKHLLQFFCYIDFTTTQNRRNPEKLQNWLNNNMQASFVRILLAIYVTFTWPFVKVFAKIIADKHSLQFSYCIGLLVNFEN